MWGRFYCAVPKKSKKMLKVTFLCKQQQQQGSGYVPLPDFSHAYGHHRQSVAGGGYTSNAGDYNIPLQSLPNPQQDVTNNSHSNGFETSSGSELASKIRLFCSSCNNQEFSTTAELNRHMETHNQELLHNHSGYTAGGMLNISIFRSRHFRKM